MRASWLMTDPVGSFAGSLTRMNGVDRSVLDAAQLVAVRERFTQMRPAIPLLGRIADRHGIDELPELDSVVPLMFDHSHYKSYPRALIDQKRFTDLTRWLDRLTTVDLSRVDVDGCTSLDEWLAVLEAQTELKPCHSSGTSGTLSFVPWSKSEFDVLGAAFATVFTQTFGVEEDSRDLPGMHVIFPYFRRGGAMLTQLNDALERHVAKGPERFHAAFDERLSSDVMYLAGRLRAAESTGQRHQVVVDPVTLARKEEFDHMLAEMPQRLERFLEGLTEELAGQRVYIVTIWHIIHNLARSGLSKGHRGVFAHDSAVTLGGGSKGMVQPDGWDREVLEFLGADEVRAAYGMTEITLAAPRCRYGHYHFNPWIVPFVLDPATSMPLPRSGSQTGRAAFFDLALTTRWGGFITGDEITLHADARCPCGQTTAFCDNVIQRIADRLGEEDKITCAATESAHQDALAFLAELEL